MPHTYFPPTCLQCLRKTHYPVDENHLPLQIMRDPIFINSKFLAPKDQKFSYLFSLGLIAKNSYEKTTVGA